MNHIKYYKEILLYLKKYFKDNNINCYKYYIVECRTILLHSDMLNVVAKYHLKWHSERQLSINIKESELINLTRKIKLKEIDGTNI